MTDDFLAYATERLTSLVPAVGKLGVTVVDVAPGRVATRIPFEGNDNHVGSMYAGSLFVVCEVLGGVIAVATFDPVRFAAIIRGGEIRYLRPATSAVVARAGLDPETIARITEEAEAQGKSDFVLEIEATDERGTVVATMRGDYQLRVRQ